MGNSNKLYFQFAVENIKKTLDAQKGEIEKWAKDNPILLEVRFKNLKSQLEQIRSIFGDNSQLTSLGNQIDSTFENARKGARRMRQSVDETSEAMQRLKSASAKENGIRELFDANASAIARTKKEIADLNKEIEYHKKVIAQGGLPSGPGADVNMWKTSLGIYQQNLSKKEQELQGLLSRRQELEQKLSAATQERTKAQIQAEREMASSINSTTAALSSQSQVLSDLRTMAMQYVSVWGAKTFIDNIIEQGGQLEQQRLSIGAILQDAAQANELFGKIKSLAIISPFGVTELDAMTKQLSAYGFKYNELYDMTKRLADISAATGTEVSRLALALGHVRSEGALSGYTLRQFSMGNIPLLEKLSEKIGVTTKEIRKMVSKKEIGYDEVLEVMKELTDEGGIFYNAQETMSQALNAKFKNLRDSFQIMYSEMAEGAPGTFLKGVAETLTELSRNWRILMPMLAAGAGALGVQKVATMALNYELSKEGVLTSKAAAQKAKYAAATNTAIAATGKWTLALRGAGRALTSLGKFLISPWTIGFAAVEGLIYLWQKHNEEVRKAAELTNSFRLTGSEGERNLTERMTGIDPYKKGMSESELKQGIDSMTQTLKDYGKGLNVAKTLQEAFGTADEGKVKSLAEQYEFLRGKMEDTIDVYKELSRTAGSFEYGINESDGGAFDDNVVTDLTQFSDALKNFDDEVTRYSTKYGDAIKKAVEAATEADPKFAKATENMASYGEKLAELWDNQQKYEQGIAATRPYTLKADPEGWSELGDSYSNYVSKKNEAMKELDQFMTGVEEKLGYDMKNLSKTQVGNLLKQTHDWLDGHPEWNNIIDVIRQKIEGRWPIKLEPEIEDDKRPLEDWLQQMHDWLKSHDSSLAVKLKPGMSREDVIKLVHDKIKETQTVIDNTSPILLRFGVDLSNIPEELPIGLRTPWGRKQAADYPVAAKENKTDKDFIKEFGLPQPKEKSGSGRKEDLNAKAVREKVRVMKEAADAFQYWRDKVGEKGAWSHVLDEFGDVLKKIGVTEDNIQDLRGNLNNVLNSKEFKAIKDPKVKLEVEKEVSKEKSQLNRKDFEKDVDKFASKVQMELDSLTRAWEIFNNVREATGNVELAVQISGVNYANGRNQNLADALKEKIQKDLSGIKEGLTIDFNVNLSDEQTQREVERAFHKMKPVQMEGESKEYYQKRLSDYESKIKGITEETKKWRDLQRDVYQRDIQNYAKVLGGLKDYHTQLQQINDEYNQMIESLDNLLKKGDISVVQYTQAQRAAEAKRDSKQWHLEGAYGNLYANFMGMAQEAFTTAYEKEIEDLNNLFDTGAIDAEEFANKINKLNEMQREFSTQGFLGIKGGVGAFLSGGWQGMKGYYQQRMNASYLNMVDARKKYGTESAQYADAEKEYQYNKDRYESMEKQEKAAESLVFAFQQLANGANLLSDLFKNMGFESGSNAMSDAGGLLSSALGGASSLSALGPWGMAAGAGIGLVSGIFALYDKQIQRQIDVLKENAAALQENTDAIKTARERTLGYDYTGELRKRMAQQYDYTAVQHKHFDSGISEFDYDVPDWSQIAMLGYYSKNSNRSGYQAELENLKEQRALYLEMYNLENSKKNQSDEALREYREKVAELDDQILYFVEDLTKELWGIDFKSWADQISDALWTAFENGEDAVEAFRDTAKDIIADVAKRMMNLHFIEPAFNQLEEALFGSLDSNGNRIGGVAYNTTTGELDENAVLRVLGEYLGEGGYMEKQIEGAQKFYELAQKASGFDFSSEDTSSSTGSSIKGITEQKADLIAGYTNAIRADVSMMRQMQSTYYEDFLINVTRGNSHLQNIENHTSAIMLSNERIASRIESLDNNINGLKNKAWRVPIA